MKIYQKFKPCAFETLWGCKYFPSFSNYFHFKSKTKTFHVQLFSQAFPPYFLKYCKQNSWIDFFKNQNILFYFWFCYFSLQWDTILEILE